MQYTPHKTQTPSSRQKGAALFMALIFLLILTILGVAGMNISRLENLMAGNALFQTTAFNDAEYTLARGVERILQIRANNEPYPSAEAGFHSIQDFGVDPEKLDWGGFTKQQVTVPGSGTGFYIIEDAGLENTDVAKDVIKKFLPDPGATVQIFLVSAQSESSRGAKRIVQSVVVTDPISY